MIINNNGNVNSNFEKTELFNIICSVPQESILLPRLSILYKNKLLCFTSQFLKRLF